jgi:4-hydroxybenzoate polyprenyltransferase
MMAFVRLALRLSMACLAVGLAVSAFRLARLPLSLPTLGAVFFIFCGARLQNDWRDRHHDLKKGKTLAYSRPKLFLLSLFACWSACCLLIGLAARQDEALALLLSAMALAGLLYSEMRRVPWAPISLSAITSASPAFLPSTLKTDAAEMWPLFAAAALLMFGREILKDLEDEKIDQGYKWTIPVAYGERTARRFAIASVVIACVSATTISPLAIIGSLAAGVALVMFWRDGAPRVIMNWLDTGAALVIAAVAAFPPSRSL